MTSRGDRSRAALRALAQSHGIEVSWRTHDGVTKTCSDETLIAVLQMLRVDICRPEHAAGALEAGQNEARAAIIEPVIVAWDGAPPSFVVRIPPAQADQSFGVVVEHESAESRWTSAELHPRPTPGGGDTGELVVELPCGFASGRHQLRVEVGARVGRATLICAPSRIASFGHGRSWGVFAPVYALHASQPARTGDLGTLERLARWTAGHGGEVIGTLPMLATFYGHGSEPCDPSPYAPASRQFWNELYLDLDALAELADGGPVVTRGEGPAPGRFVDLPALAAARRPWLEAAAARLADSPGRCLELERWLDAHGETRAYAEYRAALEGSGRRGVAFHEYTQWAMADQLADLARALDARGQTLYIDMPVGTHRAGYDVATSPHLFLADASVGAPPDGMQPLGQDWGLPPVDPAAARADGYAYLAACLDAQLKYARLLRLDHVMGLHRLWMIPAGAAVADGAYVRYAAEEQWATVCLAAARNGASIVGENLGTVPPETDESMHRHGALGVWVVQFELPARPPVAAEPPGSGLLACLDTHDLPTFAAWWDQLAPVPRGALLEALRNSGDLVTATDEAVTPAAVLAATLSWMGQSGTPLVVASLEDLWLELDAQNIPGSEGGTNFRQRAAHAIDELDDIASVVSTLTALEHARRTKR